MARLKDTVMSTGYGYASRSPRKGILAIRNPADQPGKMAVEVQTVCELPRDAPDCVFPSRTEEETVLQAALEHCPN